MNGKPGGYRERQNPMNLNKNENTREKSRSPIIVVPLDGSEEAKVALPAARLMAKIMSASIHILHCSERPVSQSELLQKINLSREETHDTVIDTAVGKPAECIVRFAAEKNASLIVMTTRGHTNYLDHIVRPVVERVASSTPCPLLLVRPEISQQVAEMRQLGSTLLPLDGAPSSAAVIGFALQLAQRCGAEINILYVATQAKCPEEAGTLTTPRYLDQPQYEWPAWTQEFLRRFATSKGQFPSGTSTRLFLRRGEPAKEILRFAIEHDEDLIVMEWRGLFETDHAAVIRGVLRDAPCPVLLLRIA